MQIQMKATSRELEINHRYTVGVEVTQGRADALVRQGFADFIGEVEEPPVETAAVPPKAERAVSRPTRPRGRPRKKV